MTTMCTVSFVPQLWGLWIIFWHSALYFKFNPYCFVIPILLLNTVLGDCLTLNCGGLPDDQFDHFAGGLFAPDIAHFFNSSSCLLHVYWLSGQCSYVWVYTPVGLCEGVPDKKILMSHDKDLVQEGCWQQSWEVRLGNALVKIWPHPGQETSLSSN